MAKAFIYEIFIDFGQIKYSKDSQELFFQQFKENKTLYNRHYYGYYVTYEESLDAYMRSQYSIFMKTEVPEQRQRFKVDVYRMALNIFTSLFNICSFSKLKSLDENIKKLTDQTNGQSKYAFQRFIHYIFLPPKTF